VNSRGLRHFLFWGMRNSIIFWLLTLIAVDTVDMLVSIRDLYLEKFIIRNIRYEPVPVFQLQMDYWSIFPSSRYLRTLFATGRWSRPTSLLSLWPWLERWRPSWPRNPSVWPRRSWRTSTRRTPSAAPPPPWPSVSRPLSSSGKISMPSPKCLNVVLLTIQADM